MWELPQITILLTNSKIAETHIFRKSFLNRIHVNLLENFYKMNF
ncbi:hypothetical protein LEP1GSC173_3270 [Leptospira interrogans str. HAI1594]|uniref:Uncharacterized protein n=1 Tax=Leptospira interrogans serovar Hardjo str. Norma TaxID=1279460 RepID=A0A0M5L921_LEPIR|nr:hypothetical protein G436_3949 [Leptospira interrogans serovar Hardjo str. Norma]EKP76906.1 hypothetical protein LEP1GSC173_3270 [Leptospira interrogans str. HAI1594]